MGVVVAQHVQGNGFIRKRHLISYDRAFSRLVGQQENNSDG